MTVFNAGTAEEVFKALGGAWQLFLGRRVAGRDTNASFACPRRHPLVVEVRVASCPVFELQVFAPAIAAKVLGAIVAVVAVPRRAAR